MKKSFKLLTLALLLIAALTLCSCDLIDKIASDLTSTETEQTSVEESSTAESSEPAPTETEPQPTETETQAKEYTIADFAGVWEGSTETETTLVLKEDMTFMYYEFGGYKYDYCKGCTGKWAFTPEGLFTMSVTLSENYDLSSMVQDDKMYLECSNSTRWTPETLVKNTHIDAKAIEEKSKEKCAELLPDGWYLTYGSTCWTDRDPDPENYTEYVFIQNGFVRIKGIPFTYDYDKYEITARFHHPYGEFVLPMAPDCKILWGNEGADPVSIEKMNELCDKQHLNECDIKIENGLVVELWRHS